MFTPSQNELADMLRYKRPAGSKAEDSFRTKFLTPLGVQWDQDGNGILHIEGSPIIWSSHTDTVHSVSGRQDVKLLSYRKDKCYAVSESNCLGADCTTGVFIMMHMIRNKVPGLYIFHYGEEKGCIGSRALVKRAGKDLGIYKAAIAFDRKGYTDIVSTQNGSSCCSDDFVSSLANILGNGYTTSSGVYTDTAEYVEHVSECTNISVGYFSQHTKHEYQDIDFALWLANHMCEVSFDSLVFKRTPTPAYSYGSYEYGGGKGYGSGYGSTYRRKEPNCIYDLVYDNPSALTCFLHQSGVSFEDLKTYTEMYKRRYGTTRFGTYR